MLDYVARNKCGSDESKLAQTWVEIDKFLTFLEKKGVIKGSNYETLESAQRLINDLLRMDTSYAQYS